MQGKRFLLAKTLMKAKFHKLLKRPSRSALFVINYHRLRASAGEHTEFDDGVFGPNQQTFLEQMKWLKKNTQLLDQEGLLHLLDKKDKKGGPYSAVTFDDGYRDCFTLARPVLDDLGIRAIFFLPVQMLCERRLGWWDITAFLLKKTSLNCINLNGTSYKLGNNRQKSLRDILTLFKMEPAEKTSDLLKKLSEACEVELPDNKVQGKELMTWENVVELLNSGHSIGSHTFSHRVLATLSPDEQGEEMLKSKAFLENKLGSKVMSIAYPVGGPQHFNMHSMIIAEKCGFKMAFSFNTGFAALPLAERFAIPRQGGTNSTMSLKAKVLFPDIMGNISTF